MLLREGENSEGSKRFGVYFTVCFSACSKPRREQTKKPTVSFVFLSLGYNCFKEKEREEKEKSQRKKGIASPVCHK